MPDELQQAVERLVLEAKVAPRRRRMTPGKVAVLAAFVVLELQAFMIYRAVSSVTVNLAEVAKHHNQVAEHLQLPARPMAVSQ